MVPIALLPVAMKIKECEEYLCFDWSTILRYNIVLYKKSKYLPIQNVETCLTRKISTHMQDVKVQIEPRIGLFVGFWNFLLPDPAAKMGRSLENFQPVGIHQG